MKKKLSGTPKPPHPAAAGFLPAAASWALADWRFNLAVAASVVLHGLLLSLNFEFPLPDKTNRNANLEVVLVNARHVKPPEQAEVLAQANLDGGGTVDEPARPTTPLPPQDSRRDGDNLIDAHKRIEQPAPEPQQPVLTRKEAPRKVAERKEQPPPVEPQPRKNEPTGLDLLDSTAAIAQLEAQIDRSLNEYAKRPRKQFIGARTREFRFARYVEDWRQKIERVGTLNYPDAARGKLYGSLLVSVVIRADGSLEKVEIQRSSGQKVLDDAAVRIVQLAAPFAAFPPDIRTDTDIIEITRTWTFTNTDKLTAQ